MKILLKGPIYNPTGVSTANREIIRALSKKGYEIQTSDIYNSSYEFNEGLDIFNKPLDAKKIDFTIFADYPQYWRDGYGKLFGYFLHEGTKLHPGWAQMMNRLPLIMVPSQATKNLFRINGVMSDIRIVPYGTNPEVYCPQSLNPSSEDYTFLYVNSWTGNEDDRKGCDLLIKAFDQEFKEDEKVKLFLKISTFWDKKPIEYYSDAIKKILGHDNKNIMINTEYLPEKELSEYYKSSDCFVMPTRAESFGLTAINALASGLPLIITKDNNSGHMDFCRGKDSVLWIDSKGMSQGDVRFFVEGNLQPVIDLESLKKQMRYAYENKEELKNKAIENSKEIRENWSWDKSADKLMEILNENSN